MKALLTLSLILIYLTFSYAKDFPLPDGVKFVFPKGLSIKAEWIVPSNSSYGKERRKVTFDLDKKGEPWLGIEGKYLYNPLKRKVFQVATPFEDFLFMPEGELIMATKDALGVLTYSNKSSDLTFLPVLALPPGEIKLCQGADKSLFVLHFNPDKGLSQVFQLSDRGAKGEALKIIEIKERVRDLCVAKENLYLVIDNMILRISLSTRKMEPFFRYTMPLKKIECLGEDQLIYATSNRVAFVNKGNSVEFAQVLNPQLRFKNQALYILLEDTLGIVKIENLSRLAELKKGEKK